MDPRLNPNLTPNRPSVVQDIKLPVPVTAAPIPVQSQPAAHLPQPAATVHQPAAPAHPAQTGSIPMAAAPPVTEADQPQPLHTPPPDDDLDKILQAVNNRVQAPSKPQPKARGQILAKLASKAPKVPKASSNKPFGVAVAVVAIVLVLSIVAVMAYRQGSKGSVLSNQASKVGTSSQAAASIQAAGGKLVSPGDLDDYSQDLGKKLNSLNDSQDFNPDALSNAVLGL